MLVAVRNAGRGGLLWVLATVGWPVSTLADYAFQPLGTFGELASEPTGLNDSGQVCGILSGT